MKKTILILILIYFTTSYAQQTQLIPEFSIGQPIGAFSEDNFGAQQGFGAGLHLEKHNLWKVFGVGLYAGYQTYATDFVAGFPSQVNEGNFNSRVLFEGNNLNWKSVQVALGPTINFKLTNKLQLQGFTKAGIAKVTYPEYRYFTEVTSPNAEQFTLFASNTPEDIQSNFNFMMTFGFRFHYNISQTFGFSLGANFTHIKGLKHTYTTRNIQVAGNDPNINLYDTLLDSEETTATYQCNINSVNGTVGITINIGGNTPNEDPIKEEPEIPIQTETLTEEFWCSKKELLSPGYNNVVILEKKPRVKFLWNNLNSVESFKGKQQFLTFYKKTDDTYTEVYSKKVDIRKYKNEVVNMKEIKISSYELYWTIETRDSKGNKLCSEDLNYKKIAVFKTIKEAVKVFPNCLNLVNNRIPRNLIRQ